MKIGLSKKGAIGLARAILFITIVVIVISAALRHKAAEEKAQFDRLDKEWIDKALLVLPEREDPRSDDGVLFAASESHEEVRLAKLRDGVGWQLSGGVIDLVKKGDTTYVLYGRQTERYEFGGWNNVLNKERSFDSVILIKYYGDGQAKVLDYHHLGTYYSQDFFGLRLTESNTIELLQRRFRGKANDAEVMGLYR